LQRPPARWRWRAAQAQVRERLGTQATSGLKRSLDDASAALEI
jgi:hypothetical protein